jgi:hypothetical protein
MGRVIIGLMGAAGAGKDAVAKILCDHHGYTRVGFADKLKAMAIDRGWNGRKDDEGRRFLQDFGMEMRRKDASYWIREALRTMDTIRGNVVISDVRFANEISTLEGRGAHLWWIDRPGVGPVNDHVSEHEWRMCSDATLILNIGTLEDLADVVADHVKNL